VITVRQLCEHFGGKQASLHGVARSFQWWLPAFDRARFRVLLCSRKRRDHAAEQMERSGLQPIYLGHATFSPLNLVKLIRMLRREDVDIIHAHGYGACTWGRLAGLLLGIPVIVHERCNTHTVPVYQRPVEWVLGRTTRWALAVSASSRQFCIEKRYMKPDAVRVLYNGILPEDVPEADPAWIRDFRRERGVGAGTPVIGIVGRLESHKGHLDAFRAMKRVLETVPHARMWVVGDGTFTKTLVDTVRAEGLEGAVDFLGFRADARKVIQCFDVQLFPSHMEGTPNTLFEALAVGNAIVASTADGQGEILEDEEHALMFEPGDDGKMARQLVRVLADDGLRQRLQHAARERGKAFDGHKTVEKMQALYEEILAAEKPAK
jgi:glycosyltransferase involved in cell wall biosynthesis